MKLLTKLKNYYFYCGIGREEYRAVKRDAYISNYEVWRILHCLMAAVFGALWVSSLFDRMMAMNSLAYLDAFLYSVAAGCIFFLLKKDSLAAQLLIYLSMSMLFLFGAVINLNKPDSNATTFIVLLLVTPMFMIDRPFFMSIELCAASTVFLVWMHGVKPPEIWKADFVNVLAFTLVGCVLNVIANSLRIREFVLTRTIRIQKDTDGLTGLKNKDALTREINEYLARGAAGRGLLFILDVDRFKAVNDTCGHDAGDQVIARLGCYLGGRFNGDEIVGRFGGDEFVLFLKGTDDLAAARAIADGVAAGAAERVVMPDGAEKLSVSIGVTAYHGQETNYSELFKKADAALYRAKDDPERRVCVYDEAPGDQAAAPCEEN